MLPNHVEYLVSSANTFKELHFIGIASECSWYMGLSVPKKYANLCSKIYVLRAQSPSSIVFIVLQSKLEVVKNCIKLCACKF